MKTYHPKKDEVQQKWWLINADGQILGRLATEIAVLLRGKNKPQFAPSADVGDFVVVVNAEKIAVTGNKLEDKMYYHHSQYPGGIKEKKLKEMLETKPEEVIRKAVWGMIPKNKLGRAIIKKLKVYRGPEHPHQAQNPEEYKF
ncbi:MAG: 50S ribosomal protein L13 [Candidatus Saccharicenans sp.]|jgi:large subunit ribosomal protein L13|nr:50S ribosomal protein L13 [Candidatus Saccharicenans sp.]MDH7574802.1 50S ribosomal protein L13 [Candidatus Saccharicenans sp.]NPV82719.1 50S ribosomal protein L13 [Candidatus Aminicenantes bacterium]